MARPDKIPFSILAATLQKNWRIYNKTLLLPALLFCSLSIMARSQLPPVVEKNDNWLWAQIRQFRSYPHLHRAYQLLEQNKLAAATQEMKTYLDIDPEDSHVRTSYLSLLYRQKNLTELARQSALLLATNPENMMAQLYQALARQTDPRATLATLRHVYQSNTASKEERIFAASNAAEIGMAHSHYLEALLALTTLATFQNTYYIHYQRGVALSAVGNFPDSERAYQTALALASTKTEKSQALSALAYLAQKNGDEEKAQVLAERILAQEPLNLDCLHTLSDIYYERKNYAAAERLARVTVSVTKKPDDRMYLANILAQRQHHAQAIEQYILIAKESKNPHLVYQSQMGMAYAYQALGQKDLAHASFEHAALIKSTPEVMAALAATRASDLLPAAPVNLSTPAAVKHPLTRHGSAKPSSLDAPLPMALSDLLASYQKDPTAYGAASIGYWYGQRGSLALAVNYFERALELKDDTEWRLYLAELYAELEDGHQAEHIEHILSGFTPGTPLDWRRVGAIHVQLGKLESQAGNHLQAIKHFETALAIQAEDMEARKLLASSLMQEERYLDALAQYLRVQGREATAQNMMNVARTYVALKQRPLALRYFNMAESARKTLNLDEQTALYAEMGYVYADEGNYIQAQQYWLKACEHGNSPELQISLAYADNMRERPSEAYARLQAIKIEKLNREQQLRLLTLSASALEKLGHIDQAASFLEQASALASSAEQHYQLALLSLKQKNNATAHAHLKLAIAMDPKNKEYQQQLAYVCKAQNDLDCAINMFENVLADQPEQVSLYQDLAYTYTQAGENEKAIDRFQKAIDRKLMSERSARATDSTHLALDAAVKLTENENDNDQTQIYAMQQQIREIERRYQFNLYQSYRANPGGQGNNLTPGFMTGGLLPSQGGMEFIYQPPGLGYQNGKILRFFVRTLWSNLTNSLSIDSRTRQAGVGVEYKPFSQINAFVSLEKILKIGSQSENNWLSRLSWGYSDGYDMQPNRSSWQQTIVYADVAYYLQGDKIRSAYIEMRHGRVFNFNNSTMLTPHLALIAREQKPDPFNASYVEVGAGFAIKHLFNATRYAAPRSSGELLLQYRKPVTRQQAGSWVFSAIVEF